jgi:hypothetical protein
VIAVLVTVLLPKGAGTGHESNVLRLCLKQ